MAIDARVFTKVGRTITTSNLVGLVLRSLKFLRLKKVLGLGGDVNFSLAL